jgi:hypothetical protein
LPGNEERKAESPDAAPNPEDAVRRYHALHSRARPRDLPPLADVTEPDKPFEEPEWHYEARGTATELHDRWAEFNWVLNDLSYISSEVVRNAQKGLKYDVDSSGRVVAMPTTLGPGADLGIYEERLARSRELLDQLNAEAEEWSKRTGNPPPDLSELNRDFAPMTMDTHRFAHRKTMELSQKQFEAWQAKYRPHPPEVGKV